MTDMAWTETCVTVLRMQPHTPPRPVAQARHPAGDIDAGGIEGNHQHRKAGQTHR
jgi:hypothetical protein